MLPQDVNDMQLVNEIKKNGSSDFVSEAINRFSGCYVSVVNNYTFVPKFERDEILQDKDSNIYKYILDYDSSRGCKLSTYISQRVKWNCMSKVNKYKEPEEVKDRFITDDCDPFSIKDGKAAIEKALSVIGDKRFSRIIQLRYMGDDVASWKEVGAKMGYSHELVRGIYLNNFNEFKKIVEKEMGGV